VRRNDQTLSEVFPSSYKQKVSDIIPNGLLSYFSSVLLGRRGLFIVYGDGVIDRLAQLFDIDRAELPGAWAAQNVEAAFNLIKP
jgi:hypothetical protein